MKRALLLFSIAAALLSCTDPDSDLDPDPASHALPVIGGAFDDGDPGVVALTDPSGRVICTGTVVSPHVVVSAGHCLLFGMPAYAYLGSDPAAGGGLFVGIADGVQHPDFNLDNLDGDLSVMILAQPVDVPFAPLNRRAPVVGEPARFVGYGYTEIGPAGEYGRKYQATTTITSVDVLNFGYGVATCNGDSGGPAFVTEAGSEVLAGVTSWGDAPCAQYGFDTRIDVYADWVQGYITQYDTASCDGDGMCELYCAAPDPDCPCAEDGFCMAGCADPASDPDCATLCAAEGTCATGCASRDPDCPITPVGGHCSVDYECGDNLCAGSACSVPCDTADPASCSDGFACVTLSGRDVCVVVACPDGSDGCPTTECECRTGGGRGRGGLAGGALLLALVIALFRPKRAH